MQDNYSLNTQHTHHLDTSTQFPFPSASSPLTAQYQMTHEQSGWNTQGNVGAFTPPGTPIGTSNRGHVTTTTVPMPSSPGSSAPVKRSRKRRIVLVASIVAALLILSGTWLALRLISNTPDVTLYNVGAQNASQYVGGGGIIYPQQQLDISYPVPERVVTVNVKPGDTVTLNQPLIGLDPAQLNAQIKEASDEVNAAQAYLNSVSAGGNSVAIAQAQEQYNLAQSRYNSLVAQADSPLLHNGNLIAPLAGIVTAVNINPGEVFAANTPLLTIMDESTVIVRVNIPLTSLGQVHVGQVAQVTPSALSSLNVNGTVISVIPQADPQTDTFQVWVAVKNPDKALLPGMSAFVRIQNTSARSMIAVPRMAVLDPLHEALVFVVRNMHAYLVHIHIVSRTINMLYVDAGLSVGAQVVLVGQYRLQDGQAVRIARIETHIG